MVKSLICAEQFLHQNQNLPFMVLSIWGKIVERNYKKLVLDIEIEKLDKEFQKLKLWQGDINYDTDNWEFIIFNLVLCHLVKGKEQLEAQIKENQKNVRKLGEGHARGLRPVWRCLPWAVLASPGMYHITLLVMS